MARFEGVVTVPLGEVRLEGELVVPEEPQGIVLFAHGSGSSRHSPRNNAVADSLRERGLATFLFDLLTEEEDVVRETRFDISLLTNRLAGATRWIADHAETAGLPVGYFGASTGAAAAMRAASERDIDVDAVVSRGGRVDMAGETATELDVPCLFIVGGEDHDVLELNEETLAKLPGEKELAIVEGAGHLFEGPGQLEEVAALAGDWFVEHLG